jgi:hypothetical protein
VTRARLGQRSGSVSKLQIPPFFAQLCALNFNLPQKFTIFWGICERARVPKRGFWGFLREFNLVVHYVHLL